MMTCCGTG